MKITDLRGLLHRDEHGLSSGRAGAPVAIYARLNLPKFRAGMPRADLPPHRAAWPSHGRGAPLRQRRRRR
jgi:hypothetical protein